MYSVTCPDAVPIAVEVIGARARPVVWDAVIDVETDKFKFWDNRSVLVNVNFGVTVAILF